MQGHGRCVSKIPGVRETDRQLSVRFKCGGHQQLGLDKRISFAAGAFWVVFAGMAAAG